MNTRARSRRKWRIAVLLPVFALCVPDAPLAEAQAFVTGDQLYNMCRDPKDIPALIRCRSYVQGVSDGLIASKKAFESRGIAIDYCPLPGVSVVKLADIVTHYLEANPDKRKHDAASSVLVALTAVYQCGNPI